MNKLIGVILIAATLVLGFFGVAHMITEPVETVEPVETPVIEEQVIDLTTPTVV